MEKGPETLGFVGRNHRIKQAICRINDVLLDADFLYGAHTECQSCHGNEVLIASVRPCEFRCTFRRVCIQDPVEQSCGGVNKLYAVLDISWL